MLSLFAEISGTDLVNFVIWVVVAGICFWLLTWLVGYAGLGEPFAKIAKVVIALVAVIIVISALLRLTGVRF
jgi:hypothetical protein